MRSPRRCEKQGDDDQAERPEKNIPIYLKETVHGLLTYHFLPICLFAMDAVVTQTEPNSHKESRILGNKCSGSYPLYFHVQQINETKTGEDVDDVLNDGDVHGKPRILHADKPTRKAVKPQCGGSSPNANMEIDCSQILHFLSSLYQYERYFQYRILKDNQEERNTHSHTDGTYQQPGGFVQIMPSVCL